MYETEQINETLLNDFYKTIFKVLEEKRYHAIIYASIKKTFQHFFPNISPNVWSKYLKDYLQPIYLMKKYNFKIRNFKNQQEQEEIFNNLFDKELEALENSTNEEDILYKELIHKIYDFLQYDKVVEFDNELYLHSCFYLYFFMDVHQEAFNKIKELKKNKTPETNYDIATNTNKDINSRIKFLTATLKPYINNPDYNSVEQETQLQFLSNYKEEHRSIPRILAAVKNLEIDDNKELISIKKLYPLVNSEREVKYKELYRSFYAYCILKMYSNSNISIDKKLDIIHITSKVIFPNLRNKDKIISKKTASQNIYEANFFSPNKLRILNFGKNPFLKYKPKQEIEETELYIKLVTKNLKKYISSN